MGDDWYRFTKNQSGSLPLDLESLEWLAARSYVTCKLNCDEYSDWVMTDCGRVMLQPCFCLQDPVRLHVMGERDPEFMGMFQLLYHMRSAGWDGGEWSSFKGSSRHKNIVEDGKDKASRKTPPPFVPVGCVDSHVDSSANPKSWWIKNDKVKIISKEYLLALLKAEATPNFPYPILHFKSRKWYEEVLAGRDPSKLPKGRSKASFNVMDGECNVVLEPERKKQRRAKKAFVAEPQDHSVASGGSDADHSQKDDDGNTSTSSKARSSSGRSSSSDSSSSDSSSDDDAGATPNTSTASTSEARDVGGGDGGGGGGGEAGISRGGGSLRPGTLLWRGFKLTMRFDKGGEHTGWEATCYKHVDESCRRTATTGDVLVSQRRLKWWCLQHGCYTSARLHKFNCPKVPPDGQLPTLGDLESMPFAEPK